MKHTWYSLFTELQHHWLLGNPIRANSDCTSNKAHPADLVSFSLIGLYENAYNSSRFSEIKKEMRSHIVLITLILSLTNTLKLTKIWISLRLGQHSSKVVSELQKQHYCLQLGKITFKPLVQIARTYHSFHSTEQLGRKLFHTSLILCGTILPLNLPIWALGCTKTTRSEVSKETRWQEDQNMTQPILFSTSTPLPLKNHYKLFSFLN